MGVFRNIHRRIGTPLTAELDPLGPLLDQPLTQLPEIAAHILCMMCILGKGHLLQDVSALFGYGLGYQVLLDLRLGQPVKDLVYQAEVLVFG